MTTAATEFLRDPTVVFAAIAAAAVLSAMALAFTTMALLGVRSRLDAIDSSNAETAAMVAGEARRMQNIVAQQRAAQIGEAIRPAAQPQSMRRSADRQKAESAGVLFQPLRKTIH